MLEVVLVGIGGLLGAVARYLSGKWLMATWSLPGYVATLLINTAGSFLLGLALVRTFGPGQPSRGQLFLVVGFCGSFTTFSSLMSDITTLARQSSTHAAVGSALLSLGLGLVAFALGAFLGRRLA